MEIDITEFYYKEETLKYSNSIANSGLSNIGTITWGNALVVAKSPEYQFINEDNKEIARQYFTNLGMGDLENSTAIELNATFIQWISSEINEESDNITVLLDGTAYYCLDS